MSEGDKQHIDALLIAADLPDIHDSDECPITWGTLRKLLVAYARRSHEENVRRLRVGSN